MLSRVRPIIAIAGLLVGACATEQESDSADAAFTELPAGIVESALDRTTNPCTDFYQFACGGYLAKVDAEGMDSLSLVFDDAEAANEEAVDEILDAMTTSPASPGEKAVSDFMTSCMAFQVGGPKPAAVVDAMSDELRSLHEAEQRGMGELVAYGLLATYGKDGPLLRLAANNDLGDRADVIALNVMPGVLRAKPVAEIKHDLEQLYPDMDAKTRAARIELITRLDQAVASAVGDENEDDVHGDGWEGLTKAMPHVDWTVVRATLGLQTVTNVNTVYTRALPAIDAILATLSTADLASYTEYRLASRWALPEASEDPGGAEEACKEAVLTALWDVVERRFVETVVGQQNVKIATAMATKIHQSFLKRLDTTKFLDSKTRAAAVAKAKAMKFSPLTMERGSYSDVALDRASFVGNQIGLARRAAVNALKSVDKEPGAVGLHLLGEYDNVNAAYSGAENRITILPGIAHGFFFGGSAAPSAHNFGALGWTIGHEITHGFDSHGRRFDAHGDAKDWWTPAAAAGFESRTKCFVDQYSGFVVAGTVDPKTGKPMHVNGRKTLAENIADNGGLRTAYDAATDSFAATKVVLGFSPEQQFFVAAGQTWCEKVGPAFAADAIATDVHAPAKARVNLTLSNFDKFAEAFRCTVRDKMVAKPACVIW